MQNKNRWWYLFKKSFVVFPAALRSGPGLPSFIAADFLAPHYAARVAGQGVLARAAMRLWRIGFDLWLPSRLRRMKALHKVSDARIAQIRPIARERFVDPAELLIHHVEDAAMLRTHVRRFEEAQLNKIYNPKYWTDGCRLHDKIAFARLCDANGVRHPRTWAWQAGGKVEITGLPEDGRVFVKPSSGMSGLGASVFDLSSCRDLDEAKARLTAEFGLKIEWYAQDCLVNHPDMTDYTLSAVSTMRVISILDEAGQAQSVATTVKVATVLGAVVDNGPARGIYFGVNPDTGEIGVGARLLGSEVFEGNPTNGVRMKGRILPFFREARALALDTHQRLFSDYAYAGWDVAITPDGPVMIEGNAKPSMAVAQRAFLRDMGPERFCELVGHHIYRNRDIARR